MGYYTRVFCSSKRKPKIIDLINNLKSIGFDIKSNLDEKDLENPNWTDFELIYDSERLPLLVELNEIGKSHGLAEEEVNEFLEFIGKPKFLQLNKKKVISQLNKTYYIVCIQLPITDIIDKGYDVNGELMSYVANNFLGMIQADKEGFYCNNKLIVKLE